MDNYENFLKLMKYRRSIRKFKPDPIPKDYVTKILDAAHYAMSGGNSQPWEFIIINDPETKRKLADAYQTDYEQAWNLELMRAKQYRHPALNTPLKDIDKALATVTDWINAPLVIAVLEDPRKQFGSVLVAFQPPVVEVLSASMGHLSMTIHLAAASLGLGSQRVDITIQQPFREILGYPEPLILNTLVPIGYRAYEPGPPQRFPLEELVHTDRYDMKKYMRNDDFLKRLKRIRILGTPGYRAPM